MQAAMDDMHILLSVGNRLSPPQTPPLAPVAWGREEAEVLLDEARALLAEGAALLVRHCRADGRAAEHDPEALGQALELFDAAIAMAPSLKCYAVRGSVDGACVGWIVAGWRLGPACVTQGSRGFALCVCGARVNEERHSTQHKPRIRLTTTYANQHPTHSGSAGGRCTT